MELGAFQEEDRRLITTLFDDSGPSSFCAPRMAAEVPGLLAGSLAWNLSLSSAWLAEAVPLHHLEIRYSYGVWRMEEGL